MEWFGGKTSIAGTEISNWILEPISKLRCRVDRL